MLPGISRVLPEISLPHTLNPYPLPIFLLPAYCPPLTSPGPLPLPPSPPPTMSKRRRKLPLSRSASDSDPDDLDPPPAPDSMETDSRSNPTAAAAPTDPRQTDVLSGTDPRLSPDHARHSDPCPSTDPARSYDLRSSYDPARSPDLRTPWADAPARATFVASEGAGHSARSATEPFLSPNGSYLVVRPCDDGVSFRRMNVFWPRKQISAICGAVDVQIEAPA